MTYSNIVHALTAVTFDGVFYCTTDSIKIVIKIISVVYKLHNIGTS